MIFRRIYGESATTRMEGDAIALDAAESKLFVAYSQEHKVVAWNTQSFKPIWARSFRTPDHESISFHIRPSVQSLLLHDDLLFVGIFKGASRILNAHDGTELKALYLRPHEIYGMAVFTPMMLTAQTATTQGFSMSCGHDDDDDDDVDDDDDDDDYDDDGDDDDEFGHLRDFRQNSQTMRTNCTYPESLVLRASGTKR